MIRTLFREANKPEPIEKIDKSGTITWGTDNLYGQFLNGMYYDNPIHGGIINQKVKFITAGGISVTGDATKLRFGSGLDLQAVVESVCLDYEIGDTFSILFKKSKTDNLWSAEPIDFELIRATENLVFFDYSEDWSKPLTQQGTKTGFKKIKSILYVAQEDTECIFTNITRPKQRYHGDKKKTLTSNYYPAPNYSGAITSILSGIEMSYFTYSEVVNGYKGGTLINLANGVPETVADEDKIIKRVKGEASNRDTQGGLTVTFSDGQDSAPTVQQINGNDLDKRYDQSKKAVRDEIMVAHGVISPALFSVMSESMFGSKEEMETAYLLFKENYVQFRQRTIESSLEWCFKRLNGFNGTIKFNDFMPLILKPKAQEVTPIAEPIVQEKMSEEIDVVSLFEKVGGTKEDFKILASRPYETFEDNEESFKDEFVLGKFAFELSDVHRQILNLISNGESYQAVNEAIGKGGAWLSKRLFELSNNGYLYNWEVTDKGQKASVPATELEVRYSYEFKPNIPNEDNGKNSRAFCSRMMGLNRMYTRDEINQISSAIGRDVWTFRGGWYHNPETEVNTPSCRHLWSQSVVVKTKK